MKPPKSLSRGMKKCSICSHPQRAEMEAEMAKGTSRVLAGRKFGVGPDTIYRHFRLHVTAETKAALKLEHYRPGIALEHVVEEEGTGLLVRLQSMRAKLLWHLDSASDLGDHKSVASISGQLLKLEELHAKANGDLIRHSARKPTSIDISQNPEFVRFRSNLIAVLRRHPAALEEVLREFAKIDTKAASEAATPVAIAVQSNEVIDVD